MTPSRRACAFARPRFAVGWHVRTFRHFDIARGQRVVIEQHKMRDYVRIVDRDACGW